MKGMNYMDTPNEQSRSQRRRRGQTFVEFGISLPLLLLLFFGIIEFGRIFQSWVTIQNSARVAARYATTGQYDNDLYPIDENLADRRDPDPNGIVPCVEEDERGTTATYDPNGDGDTMTVYVGGIESLYATWYQGENCNPRNDTHQDRRVDIARILSIFDEARVGAAGLAIAPRDTAEKLSPSSHPIPDFPADSGYEISNLGEIQEFPLFNVWTRAWPHSSDSSLRFEQPLGYDVRGWYDVMICSGRGAYYDPQNDGSLQPGNRFNTGIGSRYEGIVDGDPMAPICRLNEETPDFVLASDDDDFDGIVDDHAGRPWLDAGGAGDAITIIITYNHPLITPLGLAPYLRLQARNTAVNESFRAARAVFPVPPPVAPGESTTIDDPSPPDDPPPPPDDEVPPDPPDDSPPEPPTPIPPFDCAFIENVDVTVFGTELWIDVYNGNFETIELDSVELHWPNERYGADGMYPGQMKLGNDVFWINVDAIAIEPLYTDSVADYVSGNYPQSIIGYNQRTFAAQMANSPVVSLPADGITPNDFGNTTLTFTRPGESDDCQITLPYETPTATPTVDVLNPPTATPTPACLPGMLEVRAPEFESFGVVRFDIINYRNVPAQLTDLTIEWIQRDTRVPPTLHLAEIKAGGLLPEDPAAVSIWKGNGDGEDSTPPTTKGEALPGSWRNFNIPPTGLPVPIWVDFDGIGATSLSTTFGAAPSDFNGSVFTFLMPDCEGGSGGPGGISTESISPSSLPTPEPTDTKPPPVTAAPPPTDTPAPPTFTPSITFTPSQTFTASPTATEQPFTNTPTLTPFDSEGSGEAN